MLQAPEALYSRDIQVLRRQGEMHMNSDTEGQLARIGHSTIDRMLRPYRQWGGRKSLSTTQRSKVLKSSVPIRTYKWSSRRNSPQWSMIIRYINGK